MPVAPNDTMSEMQLKPETIMTCFPENGLRARNQPGHLEKLARLLHREAKAGVKWPVTRQT